MPRDFSFYQAPGHAPDLSGFLEAGRTYARAGEDVGASIREAAKNILISKQAEKDRDLKERMGAQDRAASMWTNMLGEMGANQRSNAGIRSANQRNVDDNAALGERAAATERAIAERQEATRRAAQLAEEQAAEQERQNASGALKMFEAMGSDPKASPTQETDFRDVDLDHSLGSVYVQGGERGLIAHFKAKGMEDAEAGQAAKAALKPMRQPFVDPARLRRFEQLATERYGEKAAQHVVKQLRDTGPGTLDEVRERLIGERASSRSQQFGGKSPGKEDKPKFQLPSGKMVEDDIGFMQGGSVEDLRANPKALAKVKSWIDQSVQEDDRFPKFGGQEEKAASDQMAFPKTAAAGQAMMAEINAARTAGYQEHWERLRDQNGWVESEAPQAAPAQQVGGGTIGERIQAEIAAGTLRTQADVTRRYAELVGGEAEAAPAQDAQPKQQRAEPEKTFIAKPRQGLAFNPVGQQRVDAVRKLSRMAEAVAKSLEIPRGTYLEPNQKRTAADDARSERASGELEAAIGQFESAYGDMTDDEKAAILTARTKKK